MKITEIEKPSKLNKPVILVGSYPPPFGGCSVHVERLSNLLYKYYDVHILDLYGRPIPKEPDTVIRCGAIKPFNLLKAFYYLRLLRPHIVHFHVSAMNNFAYVGKLLCNAMPRNCKRIITIHSGSFESAFSASGKIKRSILCSTLQSFDRIVAVNQNQRKLMEEIGFNSEKITLLPAFLPPSVVKSAGISELLTEITKSRKRILMTSGYGQKHYGYHHLIEGIKALGEDALNVHLLICLYNTYDEKYLETVESDLKQVVSYSICRELNPGEFSYLLSKCDVYIRATDRDGDAVAIREAGYFGKKVVASDIVPRPEGIILFKLGDPGDLANGIKRSLGDGESGLIPYGVENSFKHYLDLYASL